MNEAIGERKIKVGDLDLVLRPSFKALCGIETDTGKSLVKIFEEMRSGEPRFRDVASIIYHCIKDEEEKKETSVDLIGEQLMHSTMHTVAAEAFNMVVFVLSGGGTGEKKTDLEKQAIE